MTYHHLPRATPFLALFFLALLRFDACAAATVPDPSPSGGADPGGNRWVQLQLDPVPFLAAIEDSARDPHEPLSAINTSDRTDVAASKSPKDGRVSLGAAHKYLGYGTIVAAVTTAVSGSDNGFHKGAGYVTAAAALSTVVTGFLEYGDRFDLSGGFFSRDNIHIALGTVGAAVLTTAVALAEGGGENIHSGPGIGGGVLMTLAVIDIKF